MRAALHVLALAGLAAAARVSWLPRASPAALFGTRRLHMSIEPFEEADVPSVPPRPSASELYIAEKEDFQRTAELTTQLQKDATAAVNSLNLGGLLTAPTARQASEAVLSRMAMRSTVEGLSERERIVVYANNIFQLAQQSAKINVLVGHIALASVLLPQDIDKSLVIKAHVTAIRRMSADASFDGKDAQRLTAGRLLLLFSLAPFQEGELSHGLEADAMGVFMNVRMKDERKKVRNEAVREGWEGVIDRVLKKPTISGDTNEMSDEDWAEWHATARRATRHAMQLVKPQADIVTSALGLSAREQADRAVNAYALSVRSGDKSITPLSRGIAALRIYVELIAALNNLPLTANNYHNVAKDFLKGAAVSSGMVTFRIFVNFVEAYVAEILDGTRNPKSETGVDVMLLSQILAMSPMDIEYLGRRCFQDVVGEACVRMAEDPDQRPKVLPEWSLVLSLLTVKKNYWKETREDALRPIVEKKLAEGVSAADLPTDSDLDKAGALLDFEEEDLAAAVKKQMIANLASLVNELRGEVVEAVREATMHLGIGQGLDVETLPAVTPDGVEEVMDKVRLLGLTSEDARHVVLKSAREKVKELSTEALVLEQERNMKGAALTLTRAVGIGSGFVKPLLHAIDERSAEMTDYELAIDLNFRSAISEAEEVAVSEIGWGMRQDPAFEMAGKKIQVLFGMA